MSLKDIPEPEIIGKGAPENLIEAVETTARKRSGERHLMSGGKICELPSKLIVFRQR